MKWLAPRDGVSITDIALHFVFTADPGAESYRIYAAETPDFQGKNTRIYHVEQKPDCAEAYLLPKDEELLPAGTWYLQVVSDTAGEMVSDTNVNADTNADAVTAGVVPHRTEVIRIQIDALHSKVPLKTEISREHPLISIFDHSKHRFGAEYDVLPEDLKPYAAISGGAGWACPIEEIYERSMACDATGYPWITHFFSHGEVIRGHYIITPLSIAEEILRNTRNLKAVVGLEIYMGVRPDEDWVNTIYRRVIMLCGKYGIPFLHTDGNRNDVDLPSVIKRPVFTEVLREYKDYVIFSYKQNHANASYSCYGAILGAWMGGLCGHIGIQAENWYWNDAGFCDDIGGYHGYLQGNEQQIPAVFSAQMLLPGLSLGACYYSMEGEGWLMQMRGTDTYEYSSQGTAMLTLLREIIHKRLIPSKQEVTQKIHAAITAPGWGKDWGDAWKGGIFRTAFQNLYGIRHTKELFPKQLRYFYLPFVTDRPEDFAACELIDVTDITTPDQMTSQLNPLYEPWFTGDAYVTQVGKACVIMNSLENTDEAQYYSVPLNEAGGLADRVEGAVGLWQYLLLWEQDGKIHLQLAARQGSDLKTRIHCGEGFNAVSDRPIQGRYEDGWYELEITGSDKPVNVVLGPDAAPDFLPVLDNPAETEDYLTDHTPAAISGGIHGLPTIDHMANLAYGKLPIAMNAIRYPHGISLPCDSTITYELAGAYETLTMTVGFDIDVWMPIIVNHTDIVWDRYEKDISVVLKVYGDGQLLYQTPELTSTFYREPVEINVKNVDKIRFEVEGEIHSKPLWCAITGTADRYLFDASGRDDLPKPEVYLDLGNPILA